MSRKARPRLKGIAEGSTPSGRHETQMPSEPRFPCILALPVNSQAAAARYAPRARTWLFRAHRHKTLHPSATISLTATPTVTLAHYVPVRATTHLALTFAHGCGLEVSLSTTQPRPIRVAATDRSYICGLPGCGTTCGLLVGRLFDGLIISRPERGASTLDITGYLALESKDSSGHNWHTIDLYGRPWLLEIEERSLTFVFNLGDVGAGNGQRYFVKMGSHESFSSLLSHVAYIKGCALGIILDVPDEG
ncbi:hypothetical protein LXA43DRAFT_1064999 [Ganoderma leucocontextum]|nr:hypothetical protein LXA43DRAFT_1064999 [Ganoderma leucocontextum]